MDANERISYAYSVEGTVTQNIHLLIYIHQKMKIVLTFAGKSANINGP